MKKSWILFTLFALWQCSGQEKSASFQVFDLEANMHERIDSTLTWNDLASSVEVIPLETTDSNLISEFKIIDIVDDKIIGYNRQSNVSGVGAVMSSKEDIRIFNTKGEQVKMINRRGRSGEEYSNIESLALEYNPLLFKVRERKKMLVYDENGKYVRMDSLKYELGQLYCLGEGKYVGENISYRSGELYDLVVEDQYGKPITSLFPAKIDTTRKQMVMIFRYGVMTKIPDGLLYKNAYKDTIYQIAPDLSVKPYGMFKWGENREDGQREGGNSIEEALENVYKKLYVSSIYPFGDKIYISYSINRDFYGEIWTQGEGKPIVRNRDGIKFRFDNGKEIGLKPSLIKDNKAYFLVDSYKVQDEVGGINEDSNPVLIIVHLK